MTIAPGQLALAEDVLALIESGAGRTALADQSAFPEVWGYSASSQVGGAYGQQSQTTTSPNPGQPCTWIESIYTANAPGALDFSGAYLGSIPLGLYVQHVQTGNNPANNAGTHSIMGYGINAAAGDNDCVAVSGRVRKENVAGGIGDACGVWGSAYAESTQTGGTLGMEAHIYQNVGGMAFEDRLNQTWSVGLHVYSDSTGSPAKAGIGIDASGQTPGRYGFWNGIIIDKNCFAGGHIEGTVGINCASWDAFNNPQFGWKVGACWDSHIYAETQNFTITADNSIYLNTTTTDTVAGGSSVFVQLGNGVGSNFVVTGGAGGAPILTVATPTASVLASNFTIAEGQAPAASSAAGLVGQQAWDNAYFYVCVAANSWKRIPLQAF